MNSVCPICLEDMENSASICAMPLCGHTIHVKCILSAAQYDVRCPVCRTLDPEIKVRNSYTDDISHQIELMATDHRRQVLSYNRKRHRVIKKCAKLVRLCQQLKVQQKVFNEKDKELDRAWNTFQRQAWCHNESIQVLKKERQKLLRRTSNLEKRLNARVIEQIGDPPEGLLFQITNGVINL